MSLAPRPAPAPPTDIIAIELPTMTDGTQSGDAVPPQNLPPEALARGGGEGTPQLDSGRRGKGGTDTAEASALNLADRDDGMVLSPEVRSRLERNQIQRVRASSARASREDWRASREPMELTFLAEGRRGRGSHLEHRRTADTDPSSGGRAVGSPRRMGQAYGALELPPGIGERTRTPGGPVEGSQQASAGLGVRDGAPGYDHRDSARVPLARPMVPQGTPSVPANLRGRPTDNVDSEQEVAEAMQSILHASQAAGEPGPGTGGQAGPGSAGADGRSGPGAMSHALGSGQGLGIDIDPRDRRRSDYMRRVLAKLGPFTRARALMPTWAVYQGAQGVVIVTLTILADGSLASAQITRASGIAELDENFRRAILRAAPYPPLPSELGTSFRWAMPLDMRNPAVRPRSIAREEPGSEGE